MRFRSDGAQRASGRGIPVIPALASILVTAGLALASVAPVQVWASEAPTVAVSGPATPTPASAPHPSASPSAVPVPTSSTTSALDATTLVDATPPTSTSLASVPAPTTPTPTASAHVRPKVVVVVGPVGSTTARYVAMARALAAQARSYGATVTELYSPNATWERVRRAAQGAKVLIYLGHGNGYPNPYGPFDPAKADGLGLNAMAGAGDSNTRYYGESLVAAAIRLAPGALVILNHLCYASGDNEWGSGNPTRAVAIRRVDNYGAGFLRAGAAAVIADGLESPAYVLRAFFRTSRTVRQIFWGAPRATRSWAIAFASRRTHGASAVMDPYAPSRYYRSVIGRLDTTVSAWR